MTKLKGSNYLSVKHNNRTLILKIISTQGPISRIDLSKTTGLSKMAITNIVNELIENGIVKENTTFESDSLTSGRKPILLDVAENALYAIGIYISRDFFQIALSNLKGELCNIITSKFAFDESSDSFMTKLSSKLRYIIDNSNIPLDKILGIGISAIGPLDSQSGVILAPPNFYNIHETHIKEILEEQFKLNVYIDNDMNTSALAEKFYGKCAGISNFIYVGVTNGIGTGIIVNNQLYRGGNGFAGEIGHTTINFEGPKCTCGNIGCLELYASIPEIIKQAKNAIELGVKTNLPHNLTWTDIVKYAVKNDELCIKLIEKLCLYLSFGIVNLVNLFDPTAIIVGHDIALAGSLVVDRLHTIVNHRSISANYKDVTIQTSEFKDQSPLIGSAVLVLTKTIFAD